MPPTLCAFLGVFCMFGWVSTGHYAFTDELSLLQEHARSQQQTKWPDISKIVDGAKEAANEWSESTNLIDNAIHDKLDEAGSATSTAIQNVVNTLRDSLKGVLYRAKDFENKVQNAIDKFLRSSQNNPGLQTLQLSANETLNAFGTSLVPLALALNGSMGVTKSVLIASGFSRLSADIEIALTEAMSTISKADLTTMRLQQIIKELDGKVNKSGGNISRKIDRDLKVINEQLNDLVENAHTTFVEKTIEGYDLFASRFRAQVEGVLPGNYIKEIGASLDTLAPVVKNITDHVVQPIQNMHIGFDAVVNRVRESVPANARGAAAYFSVFALVISVCTSLLML